MPFWLPLPVRPPMSQVACRVRGTWRYDSPPGSICIRRLYHRYSFRERGPCSVRNLAILRIPQPVTMTWVSPSYEWPVLRACSFCCPLPLGFGLYPRAANPSIRTFISSNGPGVQPISHLFGMTDESIIAKSSNTGAQFRRQILDNRVSRKYFLMVLVL